MNCLSLSPCNPADLSSHGSVAWGLQRGKVGSLLWSLARRCGSSGFAPIRPHVDLLCWLLLPWPTKEWPYDLLGPWAFREVFYSFSGPRGYLSPTTSKSNWVTEGFGEIIELTKKTIDLLVYCMEGEYISMFNSMSNDIRQGLWCNIWNKGAFYSYDIV